MNFIGVLVFASILGSIMAQVCKTTDRRKTCLKSNELADWQRSFMKDGDPCFKRGYHRWCFTEKDIGNMYSCECTRECGCGKTVQTGPKCDNSKVPTKFVRRCGRGYGRDNTMCVLRGMGRGCGGVCNRQLTNAEKKQILKKHNDLRRKVAKGKEYGQPPASNMNELVWDDELEEVAQRWADQCIFDHESKRGYSSTTLNNPSVGQNLYQGGVTYNSADNNLEQYVQGWYNEVQGFHTGPDRFIYEERTGHYTALVWAKTKKVGCGFVHYTKSDGWYHRYLVCNYSPAGNIPGRQVYKRGKPGADCRRNNDGLCA